MVQREKVESLDIEKMGGICICDLSFLMYKSPILLSESLFCLEF
jgi:hypothetical protein